MKKLGLVVVLVFCIGSLVAQTKVAHVDAQKVYDTLPSSKAAMKAIMDFRENSVKELEEKQIAYQKAVEEYLKRKPTIPPVQQQMEERKLGENEQQIYNFQQSIEYDLQTLSTSLQEPIQKTIKEAVKKVAESQKITYVMEVNFLMYYGGGLDITNAVIAEALKMDAANVTPN